MATTDVLPETAAETFLSDAPQSTTPDVDPVIREAIDLFCECDRIDAMPDSDARNRALNTLINRVNRFEQAVPGTIQRTVLGDALKAIN